MLLTKLYALVLELVAKVRVVVTGQSHLETESIRDVVCVEHIALGTLIHCDVCLLEPALLLEVSLERSEEVVPQLTVCCSTCGCGDELVT